MKYLYAYLLFSLTLLGSYAQEVIEYPDDVENKKQLVKVDAFMITPENVKLSLQEHEYDTLGRLRADKIYKYGQINRIVYNQFDSLNRLVGYNCNQSGRSTYMKKIYLKGEKDISIDSVQSILESWPDSISTVFVIRYESNSTNIIQELQYNRNGKYMSASYKYNQKLECFLSETYTRYAIGEKPQFKQEQNTFDSLGNKIKVDVLVFPSAPSGMKFTNLFSYDKNNRLLEHVIKDSTEAIMFHHKYKYDDKNQTIVKLKFSNNRMNEEKTYYLDEYGNYIKIVTIGKIRKDRIEINYHYKN